MNNILKNEILYNKIITVLCSIKGIKKEELFKILKDKECEYLLLLLLNKYRCADMETIRRDFVKLNKRVYSYNLKKAEEKFFINGEFRRLFFEVENSLEERKNM